MRFARCDWPRRRTITRDPHCQPAVVAMLIAIMVIAGCGDSPSDADGPAVAAVEVTAPASYLATDATLQLSARTLDAAGGLVSGQAISWSSSPSAVASVDGGGLVRGLSPGAVTVTATSGGRSASVELDVVEDGPLPDELGGELHRIDFVIAAGATHHVRSDLVVIAERDIRVHGRLLAENGADVTLIARDSLVLTGVVGDTLIAVAGEVEPGATRADRQHQQSEAAGTQVELASGHTRIGLPGGNTGRISASEVVVAGISRGGDGNPTVLIENVDIFAWPGTDSRSIDASGAKGGSIHIGTPRSVTIIRERSRRNDWVRLIELVEVLGTARLVAGQGGSGFDHAHLSHATTEGHTIHATTSSGGPGGDVIIHAAAEVIIDGATLTGGSGGYGGEISEAYAPDGGFELEPGWNLAVVTGAGGGGGKVEIQAPLTSGFVRGGPGPGGHAGGFTGGAGNGGAGGAGGNLRVVPGARGPTGTGVGEVDEGRAEPKRVNTIESGNGGGAPRTDLPGGVGGDVVVEGDGTAFRVVFLSLVGNGGAGFNGCLVVPHVPGSRGGNGGRLETLVPTQEDGAQRNFRGGRGGDGQPHGNGGTGGTAREGQLPGNRTGADGRGCPAGLRAQPGSFGFDHRLGESPCPDLRVGVILVELDPPPGAAAVASSTESATWSVDGGEHAGVLQFSPASGSLSPGQSVQVEVTFNCGIQQSFLTTATFTATDVEGGSSTAIVDISGRLYARAVRLDQPVGPFQANTEILLSRITNGHVAGPDACANDHLHASSAQGISIDGEGSYPDPNPTACGYGSIVWVLIEGA